jgi:hypothetical protein
VRRVLTVGFAPSALFVCCLGVLLRADSLAGRSQWVAVPPGSAGGAAAALLGVCACSGVICLLLNPFQVGAVRVLEGYWDRWRVSAWLGRLLLARQRRRWRAAEADAHLRATGSAEEERRRALAVRRLAAMPPQGVLLPTALGNALRAGELSAGERYGLATLTSWPRIYPQIPEPLAGTVRSARDTLDASVNLCHSFLACTVLLVAALWDEPAAWWLPAAGAACAALAYHGAVLTARSYAGLMHVVYDLHRFDLARALHYPVPDRAGEHRLFRSISDALAGRPTDLPYRHGHLDDHRPGG